MTTKMIHELEPGNQFTYCNDTYVRGRFADERSCYATRLRDGKQTTFMSNIEVQII